jgi:hypothetical protein
MIDLSFDVVAAQPEIHGAAPILNFRLRICEAASRPIHAILLRCRVQIEPRRRRHSSTEQERLSGLFGEPDRWKDTLRPLIWTQASVAAPAFAGCAECVVPVNCTYDLEVVAARYLYALEDGEVPLTFLFSGTVFSKTDSGFQVEPIPWEKEAAYRMPVRVWRELMDSYFPGSAWIRLRHESLDGLQKFRARHAFISWDDAIEALLAAAEAPVR